MPVLQRYGKRQPNARIVVFISRNLKIDELSRLYKDIDGLAQNANACPIVIPCDELGVCPQYKPLLRDVRGLPGYFFGIRLTLKRAITAAYGCTPIEQPSNTPLNASFESLQFVEERLLMAERMLQACESALTDVAESSERLKECQSIVHEARADYASALSTYYETWAIYRGLKLGNRDT
ncbi:MAG TPA: hypothetical protein PK156_02325 [Polyangium sp.]|nr:hypothetical protein [Polyangium sp.]